MKINGFIENRHFEMKLICNGRRVLNDGPLSKKIV